MEVLFASGVLQAHHARRAGENSRGTLSSPRAPEQRPHIAQRATGPPQQPRTGRLNLELYVVTRAAHCEVKAIDDLVLGQCLPSAYSAP